MSMGVLGTLAVKWDPKNLEIRTYSVEKTLEPLVIQVTTLVNTKPSNKKKGRSKKARVLVAAVNHATEAFIVKGEEIANENPEVMEEMLSAVDEVRKAGDAMRPAASDFAEDPCSSVKRSVMVRAARALLSAVTRLLILADMVDVHLLLKVLRNVEDDLLKLKQSNNMEDLFNNYQKLGRDLVHANNMIARRQNDLKDPRRRDEMAAARADLKRGGPMLLTASQAWLQHPDLAAAKDNRDYIIKQMEEAMNTISNVSQAQGDSAPDPNLEGAGELISAIDELDRKIMMNPLEYNEVRTRPSLEERLESIISGAALMADSSCTRDDRKDRIVQECNAVRQALQDLLSEYMNAAKSGKDTRSEPLDAAIDHMTLKTKDLRRQLRKAVSDHVSDSFLETSIPLLILIEAAKSGNEAEVEEYAGVFAEHAGKLVEVANLACSMSNDEDGVKMVRLAAYQIETLCAQVINAARTLAARPRSKAALGNMEAFKQQWESQVKVLTEAVDDITTIDDFLAVSEGHILEDVNKCVVALQEGDVGTLDRVAGAIRGRCSRVCNVVETEMGMYEAGLYTEKVKEAINIMREDVIPVYAQCVEFAVDALSSDPQKDPDENEFIDASRMVYDGIRDIRRAVLMNRNPEDIGDESEIEQEDDYETKSKSSYQTNDEELLEEGHIGRSQMRQLPQEEREKIEEQVEEFKVEKAKLDQEMAKWDDSGNDIIIIAKKMCMIMMEMTDFTRGHGPLKNTMDVIKAAKKIADFGNKLDNLARVIAEQCPDSSSKTDLTSYLQKITLYCHQLNITSKVKAEVQNVSGELVLSGLDSASSLITAAKNLMTAVVQTVKASYVASTKYNRLKGANAVNSPIVSWKIRPPEKKPLVQRKGLENSQSNVRRGSKKTKINPVQALSEFKGKDMF